MTTRDSRRNAGPRRFITRLIFPHCGRLNKMSAWRTAIRKVTLKISGQAPRQPLRPRVVSTARLLPTVVALLLAIVLPASMATGQEPTLETLLARLQDPSGDRRMTAVASLGALGAAASEAVPPLIVSLEQTTNAQERLAIVSALGRIGTPLEPVVAALLRAATDADSDVALEATVLEAVGRMGPRTVPALVLGLNGSW